MTRKAVAASYIPITTIDALTTDRSMSCRSDNQTDMGRLLMGGRHSKTRMRVMAVLLDDRIVTAHGHQAT